MTLHWVHVSLAWAAGALLLGALSLEAIWRQRSAGKRLARLEALNAPAGRSAAAGAPVRDASPGWTGPAERGA
ncbi:hypothetical protein [Roseomonas sp. BN140053]|uniref:hypothetical protein n=1 Tax=Roseomonas sp. BN140053 TaxID=3391898 RepID=UPI0039EC2227